MSTAVASLTADLEIECPRCHQPATERLYGPCAACRADLRAKLQGEQSDLQVAEYEPKMNVTPNAVASKE
jgi:hypothetical protein